MNILMSRGRSAYPINNKRLPAKNLTKINGLIIQISPAKNFPSLLSVGENLQTNIPFKNKTEKSMNFWMTHIGKIKLRKVMNKVNIIRDEGEVFIAYNVSEIFVFSVKIMSKVKM